MADGCWLLADKAGAGDWCAELCIWSTNLQQEQLFDGGSRRPSFQLPDAFCHGLFVHT